MLAPSLAPRGGIFLPRGHLRRKKKGYVDEMRVSGKKEIRPWRTPFGECAQKNPKKKCHFHKKNFQRALTKPFSCVIIFAVQEMTMGEKSWGRSTFVNFSRFFCP